MPQVQGKGENLAPDMPVALQQRAGRGRGRSLRRVLAPVIVIGVVAIVTAVFLLAGPRSSRSVTIRVDGQQIQLRRGRAASVEQALAEAGVSLGPQDRVSPAPSSP